MEYLEERFRRRRCSLPTPRRGRAARLSVFRFDELLGDDYYAFRRGEPNELERELDALPVGSEPLRRLRLRPVGAARAGVLGVVLPARLAPGSRGCSRGRRSRAELELVAGARVSDIGIEELAARLGEVPVARRPPPGGVRRHLRLALRSAPGPHPGGGQPERRRADALSERRGQRRASACSTGAEIVAYCHSGSRSALAVQILGGSATPRATTPARGTSGREPSCRSRPRADPDAHWRRLPPLSWRSARDVCRVGGRRRVARRRSARASDRGAGSGRGASCGTSPPSRCATTSPDRAPAAAGG